MALLVVGHCLRFSRIVEKPLWQQKQPEARMDSTVTLIVTRGPLAGRKFVFSEPADCSIGRSRDCTINLPQEAEHLDISRRHCQLEIDPPTLRIRDLGSLNGTFINGKKIGQRGRPQTAWEEKTSEQPVVALTDGDEIRLGEHTAFRVCIYRNDSDSVLRKPRRSSGELRFSEPVHS
jgi:pSer/pThr/pTyr-binding forkhead associated (FHA) protein